MTKILLVEDDKSLREIYGVRLLAEGYDIVSAGDGEEALAMAIKDRPDLILSDVMMPKISGFDMLDILRSTTETKGIKVIMMTALSSEDQRQRGVSLGADRYLVKSQVGIEDVVRTVHEVLSDAPVANPAPLTTPPPAASSVAPRPPITAGPGALASTPAAQRASTPVAPPAAPVFTPPPRPAAPSTPTPTTGGLPQPTAPFSTPRPGTLAGRVIEPLSPTSNTSVPDFGHMMNQELSQAGPTPAAPQTASNDPALPPVPPTITPTSFGAPAPTTPQGASSDELDFEQTPRPAVAPPQPPTPPSMPQPPQAPNPGV